MSQPDERVDNAEAFMWAQLNKSLERQGNPEAVLYVRHLIKARPEAPSTEGPYTRVRLTLLQRTSRYNSRYSAVTGERLAWHMDELGADSRKRLPEAELMEVARRAAEPPADAVLVSSGFHSILSNVTFRAHWKHYVDGVEVEGDNIHVSVNASHGKVYSLSRQWRDVQSEPRWR
jgi:hypothetical protein